jgi:hypothetical protein
MMAWPFLADARLEDRRGPAAVRPRGAPPSSPLSSRSESKSGSSSSSYAQQHSPCQQEASIAQSGRHGLKIAVKSITILCSYSSTILVLCDSDVSS